MAVLHDKRDITINELIFTWDETFSDEDGMCHEGDDSLVFSEEDGETSVNGELSVDAYGAEGRNVYSMTLSYDEEEALRELLNKRHAMRLGEDL